MAPLCILWQATKPKQSKCCVEFHEICDHGIMALYVIDNDRQDVPRKVQKHAEGIRRANRCRFKEVWSVQKHLAELVTILLPFCCHLPICYLSPSCFAPASFPGSCLGGNSGQRWQEMARDGQRWNIWNTAVFSLRCPNMCREKRFVEQQSLPRSPKLRFSDL